MTRKKMFFSSEKAKPYLGNQYRPAEEALQDTIMWFKENSFYH
jgi:dihydroflavonol-4-reductase